MDPYRKDDGSTIRGPQSWFDGDVFVDNLVAADSVPGAISMLKVRFAPGARTHWHYHPAGQVLHVVDGCGRVQEQGEPVREIRQGDSVHAAPGTWHWHGAGSETFMTHIAVQIADGEGEFTVWADDDSPPAG